MANLPHILVADDLARDDKRKPSAPLKLAACLAEPLHGEIHVVHAYDFPQLSVPTESLTFIEGPYIGAMAEALEAESAEIRREKPALRVVSTVERGHAVDVILKELEAHKCALLVLGTHARRGVKRALLGSVAEEVIRRSTVPVLTINPHARLRERYAPRKILVPLDLTESVGHVIRWVAELARQFDSAVTLMTVVEEWVYPVVQSASLLAGGFVMPLERELQELGNMRDQQLREILEPLQSAGIRVRTQLIERASSVGGAITEAAQKDGIDLIVMGHRHVSRLEYALLGSVSRFVVREAPCPVVAIPPVLESAAKHAA